LSINNKATNTMIAKRYCKYTSDAFKKRWYGKIL